MKGRVSKLFIFFAMLTGFCITAEYALAKPSINSAFISRYGPSFYPYVWLATLPLNLLVVGLYNRFVSRIGCMKTLMITVGIGMTLNLLGAFFLTKIDWLPFIAYLWKDVYILIMLQQLWSVIHATVDHERSKYLYGLIFGVGGLGSICGSIIPTLYAVNLGSCAILFFNLPLYLLVILFYAQVLKRGEEIPTKQKADHRGGLELIRGSKTLQFILLIVVCMQMASNLFEYQFNQIVSETYTKLDLRTAFYGKWWGSIHAVNLGLQFVGSYLFAKKLGLRRSHVFVPLFLLLNAAAFLSFPTLGVICVAFGTVKAFDYSLFAILKEMLYVPLQIGEKFKAKAIIDVLAYRSAKVLASFTVIGLTSIGIGVTAWAAAVVFALWLIASVRAMRETEHTFQQG